MKKLLVSAAIAGACMFGVTGQASADGHCGSLTMAEWNWASGELMANVDKIILEEGYGCKIELIPGATTATFATMNEKGEPHVAAELWTNAVSVELDLDDDDLTIVDLRCLKTGKKKHTFSPGPSPRKGDPARRGRAPDSPVAPGRTYPPGNVGHLPQRG